MTWNLSIFDVKSDWLKDDIYVHGLKEEVKGIAHHTGGPVQLSRRLGVSYDNCLKEWVMGRAPVPLKQLEKMIDFCDPFFGEEIKQKINSKELKLSCKNSPHKVRFPKSISEDFAYFTGIMLGDGTLSGDSSNQQGNWGVFAIFDNEEHMSAFNKIFQEEFNIALKISKHVDKKCYTAWTHSKVVHWILRTFLEMHNGFKANRISIPSIILESENKQMQVAVIQGLFDSDGSKTKKDVRYASTSKVAADQMSALLNGFGVTCIQNTWLKNEKALPLHSVIICRKSSVIRFAEQIGFRHPRKAAKLQS